MGRREEGVSFLEAKFFYKVDDMIHLGCTCSIHI